MVIRLTLVTLLLTLGTSMVVAPSSIFDASSLPAVDIFADGDIYRIPITTSGVYRISTDWLRSNTDLSNGSLSSSEVKLYGQSGGPLRHDSTFEETERIQPIPLLIEDGDDGIIDQSDYLSFYAEGADRRYYDAESKTYKLEKNPYSDINYVFLKIGGTIDQKPVVLEEDIVLDGLASDQYLYSDIFHIDRFNLLDQFISTQGSGQKWYGDELSNVGTYDLGQKLSIPLNGLNEVLIEASLAGRSNTVESVSINVGESSTTKNFSPVNIGDIESLYARTISFKERTFSLSPDQPLSITFDKSSSNAKLWIDYSTVQGLAQCRYIDQPIRANNDSYIKDQNHTHLKISSETDISVWDVTNIDDIKIKSLISDGSNHTINASSDDWREYYVFSELDIITPGAGTKVNQQSVLPTSNTEFIIISTEVTRQAAQDLIEHRYSQQGIEGFIIHPQSIYDQYSSGKQDPTAIRNYVREIYRTNASFKFLLLFGDASFDYRYINKQLPRNHLVPTFETFASLDPLSAFPSDDYFALLDDDENGELRGDLDISVGRLTVSNGAEARDVVNKIIAYDNPSSEIARWKTQVAFVADDEDNNLHINDADRIAKGVSTQFPLVNQQKIYFDAFRQESTPGGNRYPGANDRLNQVVNNGALVVNYLGHGGPNGWAQERVLKIDDINSWTNFERLPLIVTATCSFTGFDHPGVTSAGEAALLNPVGGALALFTTVRSVFASKNFRLTRSVFNVLFDQEDGEYLHIGEIMRRAKNDNPTDNTNARKFFLIGDPTIRLALPTLDIKTDQINGTDLDDETQSVSVSALDEVEIRASVRQEDGSVDAGFDGIVDIFVYDKPSEIRTFANDDRSFIKSFESQQNIVYRGVALVANGLISTSFTVPVDIDYAPGAGKISYYARGNGQQDAAGYNTQLNIGGASVSPIIDDTPPVIDVFLNDRLFESGDEVPRSNKVIVDLEDDHGINVSSTAIGHEITAVIDNNSQSTIFLNDLLEGALGNPRSGTLTFLLEDLEPGPHQLEIKAFDVANNPAIATIDFVVSDNITREISVIETTPNPISDQATFHITSGLLDGNISVDMSVYDLAGRYVEDYKTVVISKDGKLDVPWSPNVAQPGIYVCYFKLKSTTSGESELSAAKKVVLLK